jgi:hypothetical protein
MKKIRINILTGIALIMVFLPLACSDILNEKPHNIYEPGYFKTTEGVNGGITALYVHLRYIYGQAYYYNSCLTGTDEYTYGQSADSNFKDADLSGAGSLTSSSSRTDVLWTQAFPNINTASGIIENATDAGFPASLIAEAYFFRAFDYFMLVQTFGGVPLDLGSGELKFNSSSSRISVRNTVPEVYTKAIFPDLLIAINDLPETGRVTGGATKTLARLYLAKAYLTYAWWLENPNNIPTYPASDRTDPDGHNAAWYYQQAYDIATYAIEHPGSFGLVETFYDLNVGTNDRNKELLLYADHTQSSEQYNGATIGYENGNAPANFAGWMVMWLSEGIRSSNNTDWDHYFQQATPLVSSVVREAAQWGGRPWTRMAPPIAVFTNTFADKTNDSRYDGTFTTVYRGNWQKGGNTAATFYNANNLLVAPGDVILTFLNEEPIETITYPLCRDYKEDGSYDEKTKSDVGAGTIAGRADFVVPPSQISRRKYPGLWKLGPYRTDNGTGVGQASSGSTRPFNIAKFSELYLVAAEAAVKGATTTSGKSARDLINVIRARAGHWKFSNANNAALTADNSAAITTATPAAIDINYILAERSREYFGEGYRWFDLVRTQKWNELAGSYTICGNEWEDRTPITVTRTIEPKHYLRPIPIEQLNGMEMTAAEKTAYQNPGY